MPEKSDAEGRSVGLSAQTILDSHENDFRPGRDKPTDEMLSLMPPEIRAIYEARIAKRPKGDG